MNTRRTNRRRVPDRQKGPATQKLGAQPECIFYEVHGDRVVTWPAQVDKSDREIIGEAAALLWKRAQAQPGDPSVAARARILRALSAADEDANLAPLERAALALNPNDRPGPSGALPSPSGSLPPRAGMDRSRNVAALVDLVELLRRGIRVGGGRPRLDHAALFLVEVVAYLFPQVAARYRGRHGTLSPKSDAADRILEAWEQRASKGGTQIANVDEELLTIDVFIAHGLPHASAKNWLRGAGRLIDRSG
jgi:hypothetical protein